MTLAIIWVREFVFCRISYEPDDPLRYFLISHVAVQLWRAIMVAIGFQSAGGRMLKASILLHDMPYQTSSIHQKIFYVFQWLFSSTADLCGFTVGSQSANKLATALYLEAKFNVLARKSIVFSGKSNYLVLPAYVNIRYSYNFFITPFAC